MNLRQKKWLDKNYDISFGGVGRYGNYVSGYKVPNWRDEKFERYCKNTYHVIHFAPLEHYVIDRLRYLYQFKNQKPKFRKLRRK